MSSDSSDDDKKEDIFEVESIIGIKTVDGVDLFKVRWKGYGPEDDTWEPRSNLIGCDDLVEEYINKNKNKKKYRKTKGAAGDQIKTEPEEDQEESTSAPSLSYDDDDDDDKDSGESASGVKVSHRKGNKKGSSQPLKDDDESSDEIKVSHRKGNKKGSSQPLKDDDESSDEKSDDIPPPQKDTFWKDLAKGMQPADFTTDMYSKVKSRRTKSTEKSSPSSSQSLSSPPSSSKGSRTKKGTKPSIGDLKTSPKSDTNKQGLKSTTDIPNQKINSDSDPDEVPLSKLAKGASTKLKDDDEDNEDLNNKQELPEQIEKAIAEIKVNTDTSLGQEKKEESLHEPETEDHPSKNNTPLQGGRSDLSLHDRSIGKNNEESSITNSPITNDSENAPCLDHMDKKLKDKANEARNLSENDDSSWERNVRDPRRQREKPRCFPLDSPKDEVANISAPPPLPRPQGGPTQQWSPHSFMLKPRLPLLPTPSSPQDDPTNFKLPTFDCDIWIKKKTNYRPEFVHQSFESLLNVVCQGDRDKLVKALSSKDHGHNLNQTILDGATLLTMAASKGYDEIIEILVNKGADPNLPAASTGYTPLMMAAEKGYVKCIAILLELGALPNVQNNDGNTALHIACSMAGPHTVEILLHYGANFGLPNKKGFTPLDIALYINKEVISKHINILSDNFKFTIRQISKRIELVKPLFNLQLFSVREGPLFVINFSHLLTYDPEHIYLLFLAPTDSLLVHRLKPLNDTLMPSPVTSVTLNEKQQLSLSPDGPFVFCLVNLQNGKNELAIHTCNPSLYPQPKEKLLVMAYKVKLNLS